MNDEKWGEVYRVQTARIVELEAQLEAEDNRLTAATHDYLQVVDKLHAERKAREEADYILAELRAAANTAHTYLVNLQPHIAQLPKECQPFIDTHIDLAMETLRKLLAA